ncbi:MAG: CPBP family intramembrane metalloprotease [Clostridia bacterium]|nr:CPBP family intramembrane metalloprotease [Clostridia bacterium]
MTTIVAILSCVLYTVSLFSHWNSYWITSLVKLILLGVLPLCYLLKNKENLKRILMLQDKSTIKIPALLGAGCCLFIWVGYGLLCRFFDSEQILAGLSAQAITKSVYPFVFIHIVLVNSFLEEFFFRGFLFRNLYLNGNKTYAYLFSSVLFALYHIGIFQSWFSVPMVLFFLIGLAFSGIFFCEVDRRCQNIYGGWLIHLGANVGINVIGACLFYLN